METTTNNTSIREIIAAHTTRPHRVDDYAKNTAAILTDGDKCFRFVKPSIETSFCHPDEPMDEAREWLRLCRTYEYFRAENLSAIDRQIEILKNAELGDLCGAFIFRDWDGFYCWGVNTDRYYLRVDAEPQPMTDDQREAIVSTLLRIREGFEKRLQTWWKRYGADKLHCWTYWAEA